jgi:serine kinase of HPr protein (carbohydrate metabolism regulator)
MTTAGIHANAVLVGDRGILLLGPSGAGKSSTSLAVLQLARLSGRHARLVADDRTILSACHGRLIARAPAALSGHVEWRGIGITTVPAAAAAVIDVVFDLIAETRMERVPEQKTVELAGLSLPLLELPVGQPDRTAAMIIQILALQYPV